MELSSICVACASFDIIPQELSVDPACSSPHEKDRLCSPHRARMTEGYCVLCSRRAPWISPFPDSRIGCCRTCFTERYGESETRRIELFWEAAPSRPAWAQPAEGPQRPA